MEVSRGAVKNYYDAIMRREITSKSVDKLLFQRHLRGLRFSRPFTTKQIDTNAMAPHPQTDPHDGGIDQILITEDFLFLVRQDGSCMVLSKESDRVICQFDHVKQVIYNVHQLSLITVLELLMSDGDAIYSFMSTSIRYIREGNPFDGQHLFRSEKSITSYSFDVTNCKGIMYSEEQRAYKIFDLRSYDILYTISNHSKRFAFFPWSQGSLMLFCDAVKKPSESPRILRLHIFNKENGEIVMKKCVDLERKATITSLTLCADKVIIQTSPLHGGLRIVDLKSDEFAELHDTNIFIHDPPIYLHHRHRFLGDLEKEDSTHMLIGIWDLNNKLIGTPAHDGSPQWRIEIPIFYFPRPKLLAEERMSLQGYILLLYQQWPGIGACIDIVDMDSPQILRRIETYMEGLNVEFYDVCTHDIFYGSYDGQILRWRF